MADRPDQRPLEFAVLLPRLKTPNFREKGTSQALCNAAFRGDEEKVTELLRQGVDVNCDSVYGHTPLHRAARGGHVGVAELLLKAGAQVDSRDRHGRTPEGIAASTDVTFGCDEDRVLEGRKKILELFAAEKMARPYLHKLKVGEKGGKLQTPFCAVSVPREAVTMETEITCQVIDPNDVTLPLKDGEMLVSDVIELGPHGTTFRKPVTVQMQYNSKSLDGATEAVVWVTEDRSQWKELATSRKGDASVAVSVDHFSIFAVISQPKQDKFTVPTEGFKLTSSTQPAVQISFPEQAVNTDTQVTVQVRVDSTFTNLEGARSSQRAVEDNKAKDESFGNLVGTSPIVNVTTESKSDVRIHKPVTVRVPHPQHYMDIQHEGPTKLRVMSCEEGTEEWKDETENTNPQESFEFVEFKVNHFARWIVLVVTDITGDTELKPIPLHLCRWLQLRAVQFIMLQSGDDANLFVVECVKAEDAEEKHSALLQRAIDLFEGQEVEIALLGNVSIPAFGSSTNQQITFHSQRGSRHQMQIMALKAKDQQSLDGQGSAAFFALPRVKVQKEEVEKQEGGLEALEQKGREAAVKHPSGKKLQGPKFLCQLPVHVPFQTRVEKFFYFTKEEVSTDWVDLAFHLGFKWATIRNIAGRNRDDKSRCMDMLQEWKKKKGDAATTEVLMEALSEAGLQSVVDGLKTKFPDIVTKKP
ncbi:positive regulation of extrinsic apoptotic signaling pathway via death domain receptors protein [Branchiostoma belcheri]|nr:positive regulation of extrinsic apoptotic signaling pathway via death domain receptors protein [Branchiostoma belcheri]